MVGRATTSGVQQSALSKSLVPPTKWSYLKLILWSAAISFVAFVAYVRVVMTSAPPVSSVPVKIYVAVAPLVFSFLFVSIWRHSRYVAVASRRAVTKCSFSYFLLTNVGWLQWVPNGS